MKNNMKKEQREKAGTQILLLFVGMVLGFLFSLPFILRVNIYQKGVSDVPIYPCDIYSGHDDWCQPYIDYGYANGAVMASRMLYECEWMKEQHFGLFSVNSEAECDPIEIINDLAKDQDTMYHFPTKVRK